MVFPRSWVVILALVTALRAFQRSQCAVLTFRSVSQARAQVLRNSKKVKKDSDQEYRDQGFTRPTVLILAP